VASLLFLLSGEHPTLPKAELKAVLESEKKRFRVTADLQQVLVLEAGIDALNAVSRKCGMTKICGFELFTCRADESEIYETLKRTPLREVLSQTGSFAVRVKRVGAPSSGISAVRLEKMLGGLIKDSYGVPVNLAKPEKSFCCVLSGDRFVMGVKVHETSSKSFMERKPMRRPFFHPSAMPSKLARCVVNLTRPRAGQVLVDPFCGTGGILLEAGLIGCRVAGSDLSLKMLKGCLRNLRYYGVDPVGLALAEASSSLFMEVDRIVTDPPYGRLSSTMGSEAAKVMVDFIAKAADSLKAGGYVCIAYPKIFSLSEAGEDCGLKKLETHQVYVHKSLTREITVFKR